ncbi:FAD binding domain-containing protein [uncultured Jatrophihabitans sp.]|uniref:FAD binding domain-containing protein n=1 Tax=uncultured Jatrophihabitans sp. TaxID=1610747 RepID=UPI0035CAC44B
MDLIDVSAYVPAATAAWQPGDAFLAGGTWLFSEPQPGVTRLLDLASFDWPALTVLPDGGVEIAATCTIAELAAWPAAHLGGPPPLMGQCCDALLASFKILHTATVGGNLCLALPAGAMTSLTAALDGTCVVWAPDGSTRTLPVVDLVTGSRQTALRPGELLRSVQLPGAALAARTAFRQISLAAHGRSAALVIGRLDAAGEVVLTVTASTTRPVQVRFPQLPETGAAVRSLDAAIGDRGGWHDDVHGDPRWRAAMTARLVGEVVAELAGAGGAR